MGDSTLATLALLQATSGANRSRSMRGPLFSEGQAHSDLETELCGLPPLQQLPPLDSPLPEQQVSGSSRAHRQGRFVAAQQLHHQHQHQHQQGQQQQQATQQHQNQQHQQSAQAQQGQMKHSQAHHGQQQLQQHLAQPGQQAQQAHGSSGYRSRSPSAGGYAGMQVRTCGPTGSGFEMRVHAGCWKPKSASEGAVCRGLCRSSSTSVLPCLHLQGGGGAGVGQAAQQYMGAAGSAGMELGQYNSWLRPGSGRQLEE